MSQQQTCTTKECAAERDTSAKSYQPRVDIVESGDALVLTADMPGIREDDVDVTLEEDILTIEATRQPFDFEGMTSTHTEFEVGNYHRRFKLAEEFDRDRIEAVLKDGVLKLTLPKAEARIAQKIEVLPASVESN